MKLKIKYTIFIFVLWLCPLLTFTQNLVPNPSFEAYSACPSAFGGPGNMNCDFWFNGNLTTADYFNACTLFSWFDVPGNFQGGQNAHTGDAYIGIWAKSGVAPDYWFEYAECELTTPLIAGHGYHVQFYVSLPGKFCALEHLGAYFTPNMILQGNTAVINVIPQIDANGGWLNDTTNWMLVEGCFVAQGGEQFMTIGNFHSFPNTPLESCPAIINSTTYYYIDDVSVEEVPVNTLDVDLGGNIVTCYDYLIEPDAPPDVNYLWSDGSTNPTLLVTQSGEYKLTISSGCDTGKDSITVTLTDKPPVVINPDAVVICPNDSLVINLDPTLGDYTWNDGSTSTTYTINSTGTYSVTLDDGCDLTSDAIHVDVLQPPEPISLGHDTIICTGTQIEYNFNPALGVFTWQDGSHNPSMIISNGGTYSVVVSNMCGSVSTEVNVEELTPFNVNLGPPEEILCNGEFLDIDLDNEYATFVWQDGSMNPHYHITTPGLYSVTMTHICGVSGDSILILQPAAPVFDLGDTIHACPGDQVTLSVSGEEGNYQWQNGSTNETFVATSSGNYSLTIENACGSAHDDVTVIFSNLITAPDLGPDINLCPGEHVVLHAGSQVANYLWQDSSTADTLIVTISGLYSVTISNQCFTYADSVQISVQDSVPKFILPDQALLCEGGTTTLDPSINGVTYSWSDGTNDTTLHVMMPGTYSVTVSNACGSYADTTTVTNGGPMPFVDLGMDTTLCPGDAIVIHPSFANVDSWLWYDSSSSDSVTVSDSGNVQVTVFNICGEAYDTLHVGLLAAVPSIDLGADTSICAGQSILLLIPNTDVNILWNDGSSGSSLTANLPGNYFATISNACGTSSDTVHLNMMSPIPLLNLGPDQPLCPGESISITPGISDVEYLWQDGSTDTSFIADHDQTVMLSISNACGTTSDTVQIFTSTAGPVVDLGNDILACEGQTVLINANISGVDYLWQDGTTGSSFNATESGNYILQVTNSCGVDRDTVQVDIYGVAPVAFLGHDTLLCDGKTLVLTAHPDAETTTLWQDGSSQAQYQVNSGGLYILTLHNRCGMSSDSILVQYQIGPSPFDLGADTILCSGESLTLAAPLTSDIIVWQDGSTSASIIADQAGIYSLSISNNCGIQSDELVLTYDDQAIQWPVIDSFNVCPGERIMLDVTQNFDAEYHWSDGSSLPLLTVTTADQYTVTITSACQELSKTFIVHNKNDCSTVHNFFIPNIFSPNGDNINDVFEVRMNDGLKIFSMQGFIFDRWGDMVFQTQSIPFSWNGEFRDHRILPGVYVYCIKVTYELNKEIIEENLTGDVTVVR